MHGSEEELASILRSVIRDSLSGIPEAGLMFSGGLDSAILAIVSRKYSGISMYTVGTKGSHDLEWATECSYTIDLPFHRIQVCRADIASSIKKVREVHAMTNPKWLTTFVGFDIALSRITEETVLCGQGADELFGGYRKYRKSTEPETQMQTDFLELESVEFPAYQRMAAHYGKNLLAPFLDSRLRDFSTRIPYHYKINDSEDKAILRRAAGFLGVPAMLSSKPKKAMQYGSGISKSVKSILKNMEV